MLTYITLGVSVGLVLGGAFIAVSYASFLAERRHRGTDMYLAFGPLEPNGNVVPIEAHRIAANRLRVEAPHRPASTTRPQIHGSRMNPVLTHRSS